MIDTEARRRIVNALERIADALEKANEADPLLAIQAALEGGGNFDETPKLPGGDDDDIPDHIRRLIER
jgi:hypothetical protein